MRQILDSAIQRWSQRRPPADLRGVHEDAGFGWKTKQQLLAAKARGYPLVQPDTLGQPGRPGHGDQSNLIIALRRGVGGFDRMPFGGPYLSDAEIAEIEQWITDGAPD